MIKNMKIFLTFFKFCMWRCFFETSLLSKQESFAKKINLKIEF